MKLNSREILPAVVVQVMIVTILILFLWKLRFKMQNITTFYKVKCNLCNLFDCYAPNIEVGKHARVT